jgi:hypothetical protein
MTVTAETRVLPEMLDETWRRIREALGSGAKTGATNFHYPATK